MANLIPTFSGRVERGQVVLHYPEHYQKALRQLEGKNIELTIDELRPVRTLKQNRRHFGLIVSAISDHTGYDKTKVHEILKAKFLKRFEEFNGEMIEVVPSSTVLSKEEFNEFMLRSEVLASELGIVIT